MIIKPELYWLVGLGLLMFVLSMMFGSVFLIKLANKSPASNQYKNNLSRLYDIAFSDPNSSTSRLWNITISCVALSIVILMLLVPVLNAV